MLDLPRGSVNRYRGENNNTLVSRKAEKRLRDFLRTRRFLSPQKEVSPEVMEQIIELLSTGGEPDCEKKEIAKEHIQRAAAALNPEAGK